MALLCYPIRCSHCLGSRGSFLVFAESLGSVNTDAGWVFSSALFTLFGRSEESSNSFGVRVSRLFRLSFDSLFQSVGEHFYRRLGVRGFHDAPQGFSEYLLRAAKGRGVNLSFSFISGAFL